MLQIWHQSNAQPYCRYLRPIPSHYFKFTGHKSNFSEASATDAVAISENKWTDDAPTTPCATVALVANLIYVA